MADAKTIEAKEPVKLLENNFGLAEHGHNIWLATAPEGVTKDDILKPEFWTHCARRLRPCDEIKIFSADMTMRLHLVVRSVGRVHAKVAILSEHKFGGVDDAVEDFESDFIVKWRSPQSLFAVIRKSDGSLVKDKFSAREDAINFVRDLTKSLAA